MGKIFTALSPKGKNVWMVFRFDEVIVLDIFAGTARLSRAVRDVGMSAMAIELLPAGQALPQHFMGASCTFLWTYESACERMRLCIQLGIAVSLENPKNFPLSGNFSWQKPSLWKLAGTIQFLITAAMVECLKRPQPGGPM